MSSHKPISDEQKLFYSSILIPTLLTIIIWTVKLFEEASGINLTFFGVLPRTLRGLLGIGTAPLVHADFAHLYSNTFPFLLLAVAVFYIYRAIAFRVFAISYFAPYIMVWIIGRQVYHIGISGVIYALAAFLIFGGIFSRNRGQAALSLLVVFLYGGMVWGILPMKNHVSWEGHLSGFVVGIVLALYFSPIRWTQQQPEIIEMEEFSQTSLSLPFYSFEYTFVDEYEQRTESTE